MSENEIKRLFFASEVMAPWPKELPHGRILRESDRHLTLAFLGNVPSQRVFDILSAFPPPPFKVGLAGQFNKLLLLPKRHPHVVAWELDWLENPQPFLSYQKQLVAWLVAHALPPHEHEEFLAHVTLCRSPFNAHQWEKAFTTLPCFVGSIHLYESMGNSIYESRWCMPLKPPFEEISHTADLAFKLWGENLEQLFIHAQLALAFHFPPLLTYFVSSFDGAHLDDLIIALNEVVSKADAELGCPYKAVSFHGEILEAEMLLTWEMIVDV